jgi:release factor glutamine methyltransferase
MTLSNSYTYSIKTLKTAYEEREAIEIVHLLLDYITGLSRTERILQKDHELLHSQEIALCASLDLLMQQVPIQYVTGETWFCGLKLYVNSDALVPRPETEELVNLVIQDNLLKSPVIMDIGTGSGCIAIALKKDIPDAKIYALDISEKALEVARKNADTCQTAIHFLQKNILHASQWTDIPSLDIIVSNPPYVLEKEQTQMGKNVLEYEPHIALFVPDDDALIFYKAIAAFGIKHLNRGGKIYFEINEIMGEKLSLLLQESGYQDIIVRRDIYGKNRMICATLR